MKFTSLKCAASAGKVIGRSGSRMSYDTCERSNFIISVPFEGFGIAGAVRLKMSYFIDILLFR